MKTLPELYPVATPILPSKNYEYIPSFKPGQPAQKVHLALKSALKTKDAAHQCFLDWFGEILNRKLYQELGFSSVNQYAKAELGFSSSKIGDYIKLARKLAKLPILKDSLTNGDLGYTKGRLLADVVDEKNEKQWVEFAVKNPRKRVEEAVKRAKKEAKDTTAHQPALLTKPARKTPAAVVPVRVNLEMSPSQFARYEKLWEKVRKQRNVAPEKVEALLEMMESFLARGSQNRSPRGDDSSAAKPGAQIHIHHCPECEASTVQTSKGELVIGKREYERYQCDSLTSLPNKRNVASIAPSVRREVLVRARHQCETTGCHHTGFLEIHHIVPRMRGGSNDLSNLKCLCGGCHRIVHAHGVGMLVKSPQEVYQWKGLYYSLDK